MTSDYPLNGSISNFRLSTSAVYANPWTAVPSSYPRAFPLTAAATTVILLQGSTPTNMITPSQTVTEYTTISSFYVPSLISNVPPSLPGAVNLASGWLYEPVSWSFTNVTFESWVNCADFSGNTFFDLRPFNGVSGTAPVICYFSNNHASLYTVGTGDFTSSASLSTNTWIHVAWVIYNGNATIYVNGVQVANASGASSAMSATHLTIGTDASAWSLSTRHFNGSIFQPMVTAKAKYTANFTPANDLSVGASSNPVLFFLNPGIGGVLKDLVTQQTMTIAGNSVSATDSRYLA